MRGAMRLASDGDGRGAVMRVDTPSGRGEAGEGGCA
jgi:hypothetical protein